MLTKREQIMNMELSKNSSFIIKREHISKKNVIDFKESDNEILRKKSTKEIENGRTIQREQDKQFKDSERQFKENQSSKLNNQDKVFKVQEAFREILRRLKNFIE